MNPIRYCKPLAAAIIFGLAAVAQAAGNPPIQLAQGIETMAGGRTPQEAAFMRMVAPRWAATLEFEVSHGRADQVPGEVQVVVRDRESGRAVMQTSTAQPLLLARLDPGDYEVEATMAGLTLQEPLVVFGGEAAKAVFVWPSNIDFAAALAPPGGEQQASARIGD